MEFNCNNAENLEEEILRRNSKSIYSKEIGVLLKNFSLFSPSVDLEKPWTTIDRNSVMIDVESYWWSVSVSIFGNTLFNMNLEDSRSFVDWLFNTYWKNLSLIIGVHKPNISTKKKYWTSKWLEWKQWYIARTLWILDKDVYKFDYEFDEDWSWYSYLVFEKAAEVKLWDDYKKKFEPWDKLNCGISLKKDWEYIQEIIKTIGWVYIDSQFESDLQSIYIIKNLDWTLYWDQFDYSTTDQFKYINDLLDIIFSLNWLEYMSLWNCEEWAITFNCICNRHTMFMTFKYPKEVKNDEFINYIRQNSPDSIYISLYDKSAGQELSQWPLIMNYDYKKQGNISELSMPMQGSIYEHNIDSPSEEVFLKLIEWWLGQWWEEDRLRMFLDRN